MTPEEIVTSVIQKLEYLRTVPIDELETGLDEVNLKMIDLRDRFIQCFRRDRQNEEVSRSLKQINLALSEIYGLEYPVTGFQRNKIEQTIATLKPLKEASFSL